MFTINGIRLIRSKYLDETLIISIEWLLKFILTDCNLKYKELSKVNQSVLIAKEAV